MRDGKRSAFKPCGGGFLRNEKGATAVEFAIVAPVFIYVLGVVIETGLMLFVEYVMQSSVQEAARQIRTGQAHTSAMNATAFKAEVCETAGIVIDCASDVTVYVNSAASFSSLKTAVPSFLNVGPSYGGPAGASSYACGASSQAVAVIATYDWDFVMPFMNLFGNVNSDQKRRLAGIATFQNEPFPSGTACS